MKPSATDRVNRIAFGSLGGNETVGWLRQVDLHTWKEAGKDERDRFEFKELGRGKWNISLFDATRKVHLKLDLLKKKVVCWYNGKVQQDLYGIREVGTKPTGWLVNRVQLGNPGERLGFFKQVGWTDWTEDDKTGKVVFRFRELYRDEWSVYLHDDSRDVNIQLDLHRNKVLYGVGNETRRDLYNINLKSVKINGWLVNKAEFDAGATKRAGGLRQTGPKTWVEDSAKAGYGIFEFHEVNRDEWTVLLHDASRKLDLHINLHKRWIYYSEHGSPPASCIGSRRST